MKRFWNRLTHNGDPATLRSLGDMIAGGCFFTAIIGAFLLGRLTA